MSRPQDQTSIDGDQAETYAEDASIDLRDPAPKVSGAGQSPDATSATRAMPVAEPPTRATPPVPETPETATQPVPVWAQGAPPPDTYIPEAVEDGVVEDVDSPLVDYPQPYAPTYLPTQFGGWWGVGLVLVVSAVVAAGVAWAKGITQQSVGWSVLASVLEVNGSATVPSWWTTALATLVAVWSWAAAGRARRSRRWVRGVAWLSMGLAALMASLTSVLALGERAAGLPAITQLGLPVLVSDRPVESVIVALGGLAALILLLVGSAGQRVLLLLAAVALVIAAGALDYFDVVALAHQSLFRLAAGWLGAVLVMAAAASERALQRWQEV
ncbi:MAG: hypothetical protein CSA58_11965 [Micrococcales bacterium]|nr:MAG: hypothetical protein CSB46_08815 [Micrococcales bacterium]PIE25963.1 MAG: hypothetical protein CSA58_11965 [Micrococcales bacterium]